MSSTQEVGEIFGEGTGPAHAMLRSPTVLIAAIGLWGMNIYFYRLFNIDYIKVLKHDLYKLRNEEYERGNQNYHNNNNNNNNNHGSSNDSVDNHTGSTSPSSLYLDDDSASSDQDDYDDDNINNQHHHRHNSSSNNNNNMLHHRIDTTTTNHQYDSSPNPHINNNNNTIPSSSLTTTSALSSTIVKTKTSKLKNLVMSPTLLSSPSSQRGTMHNNNNNHLLNHLPSAPGGMLDHENDDLYMYTTANTMDLDVEASIMENNGNHNSNEKPMLMLPSSTYSNRSVSWDRLVILSMMLLFTLHGTYYVWIDMKKGGTIGAVFSYYFIITLFIITPLQSTMWLRKATKLVFGRILELITPRFWCCGRVNEISITRPYGPRAIPFVDVFFADALCSLSKVFFDWGMLLHMAYYYPNPVPKSANNILIPSMFAAIPYLIRARQCLVMYSITKLKNDPHRNQHIYNAIKYSTSIFPLCLSAYQKTLSNVEVAANLEKYLIVLLIINASYSLFWDIVMDWGMMKNPTAAVTYACSAGSNSVVVGMSSGSTTSILDSSSSISNGVSGGSNTNMGSGGGNTISGNSLSKPSRLLILDPPNHRHSTMSCWHLLLRQRLRYGVGISVIILFTDMILRFSWTLRFLITSSSFLQSNSFVLCTQFLEVFRRALWNLLRVEWENLKQATAGNNNNVSSSTTNNNTMNHNNNHNHMNMSSNTSKHHHTQPLYRHTSNGSIQMMSVVERGNVSSSIGNINNNNNNNSIGGIDNINNNNNMKDMDDEKVKLLLQRTNAHHIVASNKVKE